MDAGNYESLLQAVLDRARRVSTQAEVFWLHRRETPAEYEANRLKTVQTRESTGIALRIVREGRIGLSSTTRADDVEGLVQRAVEMAPFGPQALADFPSPAGHDPVPVYDPALAQLPVEEVARAGQGVVERLHSAAPDVVWNGRVTRSLVSVRIVNTRGLDLAYTKTVFAAGFEGVLVQDTDMLFVWEEEASCQRVGDLSTLVQSLLGQLERARRVVEPPPSGVPVVFSPRGLGATLLEPLLAGLNGRQVVRGASPLVGRLGERVLDPRITLWDDPTTPYAPGSRPFDDEGVPTRRLPLFEGGVLRNYLFDLQTAARAGARPTGSAVRGLGSMPSPSAGVVVFSPGDTPLEEMVGGLEDALIVEQLLGAGQGNLLGGDFSGNVLLGYRVRDGSVVGRVKNTMVAGNVYQALGEVLAVSREVGRVGGTLFAPWVCCGRVSVSAAV